jgi:hypothetical protein
LLLALVAAPAFAAPDCEDDFSECKDDCVIAYGGSTRLDMKRSFEKCMRKCSKVESLCTEHEVETSSNHLEEGALDRSPGSGEVDSNNMPTRTTVAPKKPKKPAESRANEADEDAPKSSKKAPPVEARPNDEEKAPKREKKAAPVEANANEADEDAPAKPHEALHESEVPRSSRTQFKSEDDKPSKSGKSGKASAESSKSESSGGEKARRGREEQPKAERLDEDVRDDQPRAEKSPPRAEPKEEAPPPRAKRAEEKPKDAPPPKHKDEDDDLRNF